MSAIEELRASIKERIDVADSHALHVVDAVLNAEDSYHAEADEIPEWQKEEVRRRIAEWKADPSMAISWEDALKQLESHRTTGEEKHSIAPIIE